MDTYLNMFRKLLYAISIRTFFLNISNLIWEILQALEYLPNFL